MLFTFLAKIISIFPENIAKKLSRSAMDSIIKKYANITVEGLENIKDIKGSIIFICNHLSNSDAIVLNKALRDYKVIFLAGVKLANNYFTNMGFLLVDTINIKPKSADIEAIDKSIKAIKSGRNILIFPEGTRSRNISMGEGNKGVVLIQKLSHGTVIPVGLSGSEKLLPISGSGEMDKEKFQYADVHIKIGKPVQIEAREKNEDKHAYENKVINLFMRAIAELLPEDYKGIYK